MDSARALLAAVQALLKANGGLSAIVGSRVYGAPPANPTYPFVLVTAQSMPFASSSFTGMQHTLRVQGFAREQKSATALAIRELVFLTLNRNEAAIDVDGLVMVEQSGLADCFPEPDGRTYQSVIEFQVLVQ